MGSILCTCNLCLKMLNFFTNVQILSINCWYFISKLSGLLCGSPNFGLSPWDFVQDLHLLFFNYSVLRLKSFKLNNKKIYFFAITWNSSDAIIFKLLLVNLNTIKVFVQAPELLLKSEVVSLPGSQFIDFGLQFSKEEVNMSGDLLDLDNFFINWWRIVMDDRDWSCILILLIMAALHRRSRPRSFNDHLMMGCSRRVDVILIGRSVSPIFFHKGTVRVLIGCLLQSQ